MVGLSSYRTRAVPSGLIRQPALFPCRKRETGRERKAAMFRVRMPAQEHDEKRASYRTRFVDKTITSRVESVPGQAPTIQEIGNMGTIEQSHSTSKSGAAAPS